MTLNERYKNIIDWFSINMPDAQTELNYRNPYELLVAVVLSAQCTDKRVNMVTPALFERFPDPETLAQGEVSEIFALIKSVSYPNAKATNLKAMAQSLVSDFDGEVPDNDEQLQQLKGVGRKTANVIISVIFDKPAMAVDTHVFRVSRRIGLTRGARTPLQTEEQLVKHIPQHLLGKAHHWLILHGRYVCTARSPKCDQCGISPFCSRVGVKD